MFLPRRLWIWGFGYGVVLGWLGIMAAGAGHGAYSLLGIAAAPLSLFGIRAAVLGAPLFWGFAGWFISKTGRFDRVAFLWIVAVHYGSAMLGSRSGVFADWEYLPRLANDDPAILGAWSASYLTGQAFLWYLFATASTAPNKPVQPTRACGPRG